ncbi:PQQ-dependent dehydrogenase, methanol/ethanol family [Cupriavidus necator]|uniref:PQQ-dependent dehydrogenase, methanol/ethanol family n=1 Tax=Cupriavidus necator TaxID=106590 RepID=UPI0003044DB6|nr:PQQ-dependent dehydrogenase, methanol/ethanol family [Cupriavidus necator]MDX6008181.1 PQQ-dependent dehydrogenase, methanol/ethanol family [Cupriavidus necator]
MSEMDSTAAVPAMTEQGCPAGLPGSRPTTVLATCLRLTIAAFLALGTSGVPAAPGAQASAHRLADGNTGGDWAGWGRTYGEQHFSPLSEINGGNVNKLGLAWSVDLPPGNAVSVPLAVGGTLFYTTGYSVIHAVNAASGKPLWRFDPKAAEAAGERLRQGWGSRGIAWWNGMIFTGTQDGRLIAVNAATGREIWSTQTLEPGDHRFISGAPRVFDGKVIIGHGGADSGAARGYVTAYDARTGKQLWRFWTVPGNPANGFENDAMKMAARTWSGEWWKFGGGGTVWNAMSYDADTDTVFIGTGNGAPWNHRIRSKGKGDNLFLCSIVAIDGKTGAYKWHYQVNPGESWDYNAAMDMHLADLAINGTMRKVLIQAPKNGFLYVIDRLTGQLISAEKIAKVTWADRIDIATGRPVEHPGARFPDGTTFEMWPSNSGAHSWQPSAYSPLTRLVYIPVRETGIAMNDQGIDPDTWTYQGGNKPNLGLNLAPVKPDPLNNTSRLLAWDPVARQEAWRVATPGAWNGGLMATAGNLVFQGQIDGRINGYDSKTGRRLWSFDAGAGILAPPITYTANGKQYLTVLTGVGTSAGIDSSQLAATPDYRTQQRRVLTFALNGKAVLSANKTVVPEPVRDADYRPDNQMAMRGMMTFLSHCIECHGIGAIAAGAAPDLRASAIPLYGEAFRHIVHGGALVSQGMPRFTEFTGPQLDDLRQYIRSEAAAWRQRESERNPG